MKREIHRSHLGGKCRTILLVKMGRNKEEDRKGIVETYLGSGVKRDVNTVVLSLVKRGCLSFSWAPPAASPHLPSHRGEAKAWQQVRQPCSLPQALVFTASGCTCCFRGELKQVPHMAIILCPPRLTFTWWSAALLMVQLLWGNAGAGGLLYRLNGSFASAQQCRAHRVHCWKQIRKFLAPDSHA